NGTLTLALSFSLVGAIGDADGQSFDYEFFWKRSLVAAICCQRLGSVMEGMPKEELFLAGLLQDIGMLALDKADPDFYKGMEVNYQDHQSVQEKEQELLGADHAQIGSWLLQQWNLPERLQCVVAGSHDPQVDGIPEVYLPLVNCVSVSSLLADAALVADAARSPAFDKAAEIIEQRLGLEREDLDSLIALLDTDLQEAQEMYEMDLQDFSFSESLLDQARETLMLRNLQGIQQAAELQQSAAELESRTRVLEEKSRRDGLTGLYNRVYLDQRIADEFRLSRSRGWPMAVIFLDLDHFKSVNDKYGHQAGDIVLRMAASLLTDCTREEDIVARYGGEEFVVILPGHAEESARIVADRIINVFRSTQYEVHEDTVISITASLGVAVQGGKSDYPDVGELLRAADNAVYAAKRAGRDRYVFYKSEMANNSKETSSA
ncbi:MAG: diguanylate cyclase, partial [Gammaproteobacteria bacterium]